MPKPREPRTIASNRRARHEYFIEKTFEAGIELRGTEVKSLRNGNASLVDSYAATAGRDLIVHNVHIPPYEQGNRYNVDTKRPRRLLMHRAEIAKLAGRISQPGYTLIPLRLYFNERNRAKLELGLCRGKRAYDKREAIKQRDLRREADREMRER